MINGRVDFTLDSKKYKKISKDLKKKYRKVFRYIEKHPLKVIIISLIILLLVIFIGNLLRTPPKENIDTDRKVKNVEVFEINKNPSIIVQAQIEKNGIATIVSLSSGVVKEIHVKEGDFVNSSKRLVSLSSNYQGENSTSVQRQIAGAQYQNAKDTYNTQKELIENQRDLANKQNENSGELRNISDDSIKKTEDLIDLNRNIINSVNSNLKELELTNIGGANDDQILSTKQLKSQIQSTLNQLELGLNNTKHQSSDDSTPVQIINLSKDITLKQLEIQQKTLDLLLKTSSLQFQLALIQEAAMFPSAPFKGVVERIYIKKGQVVSPGTPLLIIHGDQTLKLIAKVPFDISKLVSVNMPATITIKGKKIELIPNYVSQDVTDGNLASITFELSNEYQNDIADKSFIPISIPLSGTETNKTSLFIPIDGVHLTQSGAFVYVVDGNKAKSKEVKLGIIRGSFIEVLDKSLSNFDQIILNRNILDEDLISIN